MPLQNFLALLCFSPSRCSTLESVISHLTRYKLAKEESISHLLTRRSLTNSINISDFIIKTRAVDISQTDRRIGLIPPPKNAAFKGGLDGPTTQF